METAVSSNTMKLRKAKAKVNVDKVLKEVAANIAETGEKAERVAVAVTVIAAAAVAKAKAADEATASPQVAKARDDLHADFSLKVDAMQASPASTGIPKLASVGKMVNALTIGTLASTFTWNSHNPSVVRHATQPLEAVIAAKGVNEPPHLRGLPSAPQANKAHTSPPPGHEHQEVLVNMDDVRKGRDAADVQIRHIRKTTERIRSVRSLVGKESLAQAPLLYRPRQHHADQGEASAVPLST